MLVRPLGASLLLFAACLFAPAWGADRAATADVAGKAGVVTRDFAPTARRHWRGAAEHKLRVTVWYPAAASATETMQLVGPPEKPLFEAGMAMPHAAFAPALDPLPLILLSHGSGGSAQQLGWLGTALAHAGFIAAAVDHPGNNAVTGTTPEGFVLWWERATDLSEVLDGLEADSELGPHIDKQRVGAAGFSLGGYTALELAGAQTDVASFYDLCRKEPTNPNCRTPEMRGMPEGEALLASVRKTGGESIARSGESYRDPRIRAIFLIAPALGFTQTRESLRSIRLPAEIVVGSADPIAPPSNNADFIKGSVRGARETVLPNVAHYTFLDTCTADGQSSFAMYCSDPAGVSRDAVHAQVAGMAVSFFGKSLR